MYKIVSEGLYYSEENHTTIPADPNNTQYKLVQEWLDAGNVPEPFVIAQEPFSKPPAVVAAARGVTIADGDIAGIGGLYNVAMVLYAGVGTLMIFYVQPLTAVAFVSGTNGLNVSLTENESEYCTLEIRDALGELADPERLDVVLSAM